MKKSIVLLVLMLIALFIVLYLRDKPAMMTNQAVTTNCESSATGKIADVIIEDVIFQNAAGKELIEFVSGWIDLTNAAVIQRIG